MKLIYTIIVFSVFQMHCIGQNISIYKIEADGKKGQLSRVNTYENSQLTKVRQYDEKGRLEFVIVNTYNDKKELVKEVKTFKSDHEYDLVKEYYYDSEGRKSGLLGGNNLTGKWYSERYLYNAKSDIDTVFYYQKNGDLINVLVHEYEYDEQGRKVKLLQRNIDVEMEEEKNTSVFIYQYNRNGFDEKIIEKDEKGIVIYEEWQTNTASGKPKIVEYKMLDLIKSKTVYFYNSKGKLSKKVEYIDGVLAVTATYKYNNKGKITEERFKTKNGYNGEIYVY
jgi:hypothetical protein